MNTLHFSRLHKLFSQSPRLTYHQLRLKLTKQVLDRTFQASHPCIFVLSTGRVGTQTLATLADKAPNVFVQHEPKPLLYGLSKLSYHYSDNEVGRHVLREAFCVARRDLLDYSLICRRGYVETSPQATFLAPVIQEVIPSVKFIHLVRDPHEVIRSGMRRKWYAGHPADRTRIVPNPQTPHTEQWSHYSTFQKNVWLWMETNRWIDEFFGDLPPERKLMLRAEDLFVGDEKTVTRFYQFIGPHVPSPHKIQHVLSQQLNAQKKGDFPKQDLWSQEMREQFAAIVGTLPQKFGYDIE